MLIASRWVWGRQWGRGADGSRRRFPACSMIYSSIKRVFCIAESAVKDGQGGEEWETRVRREGRTLGA